MPTTGRLAAMFRSLIAAVLGLLLAVVLGIAFMYAYRARSPEGSITGDSTPLIAVAVPAILAALLPLAIIFLVVYAAVRLAVRHESAHTQGRRHR